MMKVSKIDLHIHTKVSDGTDDPDGILQIVKRAGIELFSVTDHDALKACRRVLELREEDDPLFLTGVEFSCKDEEGKYHILGYGYDLESPSINSVIDKGHGFRMKKVMARLEFLRDRFGFRFPQDEIDRLLSLDNPGKPHIGNLMVKYGFAETKEKAIKEYIDQIRFRSEYVRPEEAIAGILGSGGIPILAHPTYGDGDQLILGEEMDHRIRKLMEFGLKGLEAYYSGFTEKIRDEILHFAEHYDLFVTAGSDYHGSNKLVDLGDTGLQDASFGAENLHRFLKEALKDNR